MFLCLDILSFLQTLKQSSQLSFLWRLKTDAVITDSVKCSFSLQFQEKMDETLTDDFYTFSTEVSIDIVLVSHRGRCSRRLQ